jgi:putative pyruvate formate lyase activating enzyme
LTRPSYIGLYENGRLEQAAKELHGRLSHCTLCPHRCGVDRTGGNKGRCKTGALPAVSSFNAHFGEEAPLTGTNGSGTIFFTNCNLACIYCQNYDISQLGRGQEVSFEDLASIMLHLQNKGCHNINLVSPTHLNHAIVAALIIAVPRGLRLPLVYNSGGYDAVDVLKILEGTYDIYMPDLKYMDPDAAGRLSGAADYPSVAAAAVREMHRQVGDLELSGSGIAVRGLLLRHLVLPHNIAATDRIIDFVASLSRNTYLNIMDQYRPQYRAHECFELGRRITLSEYDEAVKYARACGLARIDGSVIK